MRNSTTIVFVLASAILVVGLTTPSRSDTLLHYDFADGSGDTVTDLSGNGNDGSLVDFLDVSAGGGEFGVSEGWITGGGLSFLDDGVRSFVDTPLEVSALGDPSVGTLSHTVEFLASYSGSQGWTPTIGSDHGPSFSDSDAFFLGIDTTTTQLHVRTPSGGAGNVGPQPWQGDNGLQNETSHHLAYVYDFDSDEIETFVDGVSAGVSSTGFALNMGLAESDIVYRVGNVGWNNGEQWGGVLQGVAISAAALGPASFALTQGNQPSTVLNYDFSDGRGDTVTDTSGQGNDGQLVDFVDTSAGQGTFNSSEGWVAGGGLSFLDDGQRSYVETPLEINTLDESFTIELVSNYAAPQGWSPVVGSSQDPFDANNALFAGVSDTATALHFRGPGWSGNIGDQPWLSDGRDSEEVHHVAMRYDEDTGEIEAYVDGVFLGTMTLANSDYNLATSLFRIANVGWASGEQWAGVIHGVAISDEYLEPHQFVLSRTGEMAGDYNGDGVVNAADIDLQAAEMKKPNPDLAKFDENGDGVVDLGDRNDWIKVHAATWVGDSNLDREFNSTDLVKVFADGLYETGEMATWSSGDWDGDMQFGSSDLVFAFTDGGYETGPPALAAVAAPEPCSMVLSLLGLVGLVSVVRTQTSSSASQPSIANARARRQTRRSRTRRRYC